LKDVVIRKEVCNFKIHMVTVPDNENFEKVKKYCFGKLEKAINYLKWEREKYRINRIDLDKVRNVEKNIGYKK
jgi:hypothetical protein